MRRNEVLLFCGSHIPPYRIGCRILHNKERIIIQWMAAHNYTCFAEISDRWIGDLGSINSDTLHLPIFSYLVKDIVVKGTASLALVATSRHSLAELIARSQSYSSRQSHRPQPAFSPYRLPSVSMLIPHCNTSKLLGVWSPNIIFSYREYIGFTAGACEPRLLMHIGVDAARQYMPRTTHHYPS